MHCTKCRVYSTVCYKISLVLDVSGVSRHCPNKMFVQNLSFYACSCTLGGGGEGEREGRRRKGGELREQGKEDREEDV
jgi:hypothetical protein